MDGYFEDDELGDAWIGEAVQMPMLLRKMRIDPMALAALCYQMW